MSRFALPSTDYDAVYKTGTKNQKMFVIEEHTVHDTDRDAVLRNQNTNYDFFYRNYTKHKNEYTKFELCIMLLTSIIYI